MIDPSAVTNLIISAHLPRILRVEWEEPSDPGCPLKDLTYDVTYEVVEPIACRSTISDNDDASRGSMTGIRDTNVNINSLHPYSTYIVKVKAVHTEAGSGDAAFKNATTLKNSENASYPYIDQFLFIDMLL